MSQLDAQRRLHGMELAGFILVAEIVDEPFKGSIQPGMPCPPPPVFRPSLRPPLRPPFIRPLYPPSPRAPVPIAPHLKYLDLPSFPFRVFLSSVVVLVFTMLHPHCFSTSILKQRSQLFAILPMVCVHKKLNL